MLDRYALRLATTAEGLAYVVASADWLRVYLDPSRQRLCLAAACTAAGFGIDFLRISLAIVMHPI